MGKTEIQWTNRSVNPIRARNKETGKIGWWCAHVSPGCESCYAEARNKWIGNGVSYLAQMRNRVELFIDQRMLGEPFSVRKPSMWFLCSMTDLFGEFVPDEIIDICVAMMAMNEKHTFQCLTKRHERMRAYLQEDRRAQVGEQIAKLAALWKTEPVDVVHPLPNVWFGVSVEDQRRADERLQVLRATPATVRMVSFEPLLEPINVRGMLSGIHWGIIGGKSAQTDAPFHCEWGLDLIDQLRAERVAPYMKQIGMAPYFEGQRVLLQKDPKGGGDPSEWPTPSLNVREYPRVRP